MSEKSTTAGINLSADQISPDLHQKLIYIQSKMQIKHRKSITKKTTAIIALEIGADLIEQNIREGNFMDDKF